MDSKTRLQAGLDTKSKINNAEFMKTMTRIRDAAQRLSELLAYSDKCTNKILKNKTMTYSKICSTTSLACNISKNGFAVVNPSPKLDLYSPVPDHKAMNTLSHSTCLKCNNSTQPTYLPISSKVEHYPPVEHKYTCLINNHNKTKPFGKEHNLLPESPQVAEKTTYCRPTVNLHNQEFTDEMYTNLQVLVKRLALARKKEKQIESWNNYINDLKKKHKYYYCKLSKSTKLLTENLSTNVIAKDFCNRRCVSKRQSRIYEYRGSANSPILDGNIPQSSDIKNYKYSRKHYCLPFPSLSHAALSDRDRNKNRYFFNKPNHTTWISRDTSITNKESKSIRRECSVNEPSESFEVGFQCSECIQNNTNGVMQSNRTAKIQILQNVQNDCMYEEEPCFENYDKSKQDIKKELEEKIHGHCDKVLTDSEKTEQAQHNKKCSSLQNIEKKLDTLIFSVNTLIMELRSKKWDMDAKTSTDLSYGQICGPEYIKRAISDTFNVLKKRNIICSVANIQGTTTLFGRSRKELNSVDEIWSGEINKNATVKKHIDNLSNKKDSPCATRGAIDVPTIELSSEPKDSKCKTTTQQGEVEDFEGGDDSAHVTMALNTNPLGLQTLFRVSAITAKQILSYMPHMDYTTCWARLQNNGCDITTSVGVSGYICPICDLAFTHPSQLNDHIQRQHKMEKSRECSVCRHVIDNKINQSGLFPCSMCGQLFTRAYCRELHEQTCCRRRDKNDVIPSLMLLT